MGYAAEKKKAEGKWRRLKRILFVILLCLMLVAVTVSIVIPPTTWKYRVALPDIDGRKSGELRVHFIDVGQGDATLIELPDGKIALVDGGSDSEQSEKSLMRYLYALNIDTIDYLFVTHPDADYCGGLDTVVKYMRVKCAYLPLCNSTVNTEYARFYASIVKEKDCRISYLNSDVQLLGEGYTLACLYPFVFETNAAEEADEGLDGDTNEYAAALWLEYQGISALLTSDFSMAEEGLLIENTRWDLTDTEVLQVGHHGSKNAMGEELLAHIGAEKAVISCGENGYGHPSEETLAHLQAAGVQTYRTDVQGSIVLRVQNSGEYTLSPLGNS